MKPIIIAAILLFSLSTSTMSQSLSDYQWKSRLVLLFTPTPDHPEFEQQLKLLSEQQEVFKERDVVFISITPGGEAENITPFITKAEANKYYDRFAVARNQFTLVLVGLDGTEKFRASSRVTQSSVLQELIDGMPMRRQEVRRKKGGTENPR
jgi:hypothetical protein